MNNLDQFVDRIALIGEASYDTCIRLLVECMALVKDDLPVIGLEALSIAEKYWIDKSIVSAELESVRVRCWRFLDERNATTNVQEKQYCALRAVMCVLYAEPPSDDIGELLEFFMEMISAVVSVQAIEKKLLALMD
jgi:hypothetical protein